MKVLVSVLLLVFTISGITQERIDGSFEFQTDPDKDYSLFIPEGYDPDVPHRLMLGLHPWNTTNWNSSIWCDSLVVFGTMNDLIIVCPDGGADGQIDDPIDTAFTSALLDSVHLWYNIDVEKRYAMGFSWGGKTVYTYGLNHIDRFNGFIPIGAAINGTSDIDNVLNNAAGLPWYLVHGDEDAPDDRYYPLLNGLDDNNAITNSNLMSGVGHTFNFPDRNEILTTAFQWVDSVNCAAPVGVQEIAELNSVQLMPSPVRSGEDLTLVIEHADGGLVEISLFSMKGQMIEHSRVQLAPGRSERKVSMNGVEAGSYIAMIKGAELDQTISFIVLD